jgi:hypothetical protein
MNLLFLFISSLLNEMLNHCSLILSIKRMRGPINQSINQSINQDEIIQSINQSR